jgi:hypothetical protein
MGNRISIEDFKKISKKAMNEAKEETLSEFNSICNMVIKISIIMVALGTILLLFCSN